MTLPSEPTVIVDEKFDDEPVPAMPSRPASPDVRIMGMAADTWAVMIERKIDATFRAQHDAMVALGQNFAAVKTEIRDGFSRVFEVLKAQERHEQLIGDHGTRLLEGERHRNSTDDRIAKLERDTAEHRAHLKKLDHAAKRRSTGRK